MSTTISVPVSQPDRFELGQLELSDSITLGDSASVTLNFVNKGRNALSNLEATLSGDNLGADTTVQYIGNLNAGSSNSVDFDMTPTQEGTCKRSPLTLTYEDANGTLKPSAKIFPSLFSRPWTTAILAIWTLTWMTCSPSRPACPCGPIWQSALL